MSRISRAKNTARPFFFPVDTNNLLAVMTLDSSSPLIPMSTLNYSSSWLVRSMSSESQKYCGHKLVLFQWKSVGECTLFYLFSAKSRHCTLNFPEWNGNCHCLRSTLRHITEMWKQHCAPSFSPVIAWKKRFLLRALFLYVLSIRDIPQIMCAQINNMADGGQYTK